MKIDRRSFLAFVLGGAAGTALSPLPWKLTDDISIWTQNWPWTPVPPKGETTYVASTCTLCPGGCGIRVRRVEDRVVKIEGRKDHPVNRGGICPLGAAGAQLLYSPWRVRQPLKKVDGRFVPVSWEQAIGEIAGELRELREAGSPEAVAWIADTDRGTTAELIRRFLTVYGSPNFIRTPSAQDAWETALYLTQGQRATAGFDLERTSFLLSLGSGLLEGWGTPPFVFRACGAVRDRNGRFVQVEPRLSKTAAQADQWLPILPGSEATLAFGLIHVILKEGLERKPFVASRTTGLEDLRRNALREAYAPEAVAQATGLEAKTVVELARAFAAAERPLAVCGRGAGRVPGGLQETLAVHFLNALVGSVNVEGGVIAVPEPEYIRWPEPEMDAVASKGMQTPRVDGAGSDRFPLARYLLNRLPEALLEGEKPAVRVLFVSGGNPLYSLPDSERTAKAFARVPLLVSFSSFFDETAAAAHYVLPAPTYLERWEDVPGAAGFPKPVIGLARPVVAPRLATMPTGDVVIRLARRLGGTLRAAFPWESHEVCLRQTFAASWEPLRRNGFAIDESFKPQPFETASRRFEFGNADLKRLAEFRPLPAPGDPGVFKLTLVPYDSLRLTAALGTPPFLVKALESEILWKNDIRVEIHPQTARDLGLADGADARLVTPRGEARVKLYLTEGIRPGLIGMARGLGREAHDRFLAGRGVSTNRLLAAVEDPSGFEAGWGIRARLERA
ncbi:MAG: menaquinone reductase molybdopterin-binding-like subunit QrcB [Desulfobacterales bacterium]